MVANWKFELRNGNLKSWFQVRIRSRVPNFMGKKETIKGDPKNCMGVCVCGGGGGGAARGRGGERGAENGTPKLQSSNLENWKMEI